MDDDHLVRLRELAAMTGAPTWIPSVIREIERLRARLAELERENEDLTRRLAFQRRTAA